MGAGKRAHKLGYCPNPYKYLLRLREPDPDPYSIIPNCVYKKKLFLKIYALLWVVAGSSLVAADVCVEIVITASNTNIVLPAAHTFQKIFWPDYYL